MGIFDKIVPGNESRTPMFPVAVGQYKAVVESFKFLDGSGAKGTKAVVVDFVVKESTHPDVGVDEFRSKFFSLNGNEFPGAILTQARELLTFLVAAMGYDPDDAAAVEAFRKAYPDAEALYTNPASPLLGRPIGISVTTKILGPRSKRAGEPSPLFAWSPGNDPTTTTASTALETYAVGGASVQAASPPAGATHVLRAGAWVAL